MGVTDDSISPVKVFKLSGKTTEPPLFFLSTGRVVVVDGKTVLAFTTGNDKPSAEKPQMAFGSTIPVFNTAWSYSLPDSIESQGVSGLAPIGDDFVFASGKQFYRFDSTQGADAGAKLLKTSLDLGVSSIVNPPVTEDLLSPITRDSRIILLTRSGQLIVLDNGDEVVSLNINRGYRAVDTQPEVDKDGQAVYFVASGKLIAVDLKSGAELTNKPLPTERNYVGRVVDASAQENKNIPKFMRSSTSSYSDVTFTFGLKILPDVGLISTNEGVMISLSPDIEGGLLADRRDLAFSATFYSWIPFSRKTNIFGDLTAFRADIGANGSLTNSKTIAWHHIPDSDFVIMVNKNESFTHTPQNISGKPTIIRNTLKPLSQGVSVTEFSYHLQPISGQDLYTLEIYPNRQDVSWERLKEPVPFIPSSGNEPFITVLSSSSDTAVQKLFLVAMGSEMQIFMVSLNNGTPSSLQNYSGVIKTRDFTITAPPAQGLNGSLYATGVDANNAAWLVEYDIGEYLNQKK